MIIIKSISTDSLSNTTKVLVEIYEYRGTIEKLVDTLVINLKGKYESITDELRTLVDEELIKNGFTYNPTNG
jgi:hypothetical protein